MPPEEEHTSPHLVRSELAPSPVPRPADWMFLQPEILDLLHDAVITTDLQGVITGCNLAARRIYGFSSEELTGKSVALFYSEEDQRVLTETVLPAVLSEGKFQGEVRNRTQAGGYIFVHLSIALLRDAENVAVGMVGLSVDVTAQKLGQLATARHDEIEKKLEREIENSDFLRTLKRAVERSTDAILITEAEPVDEPGPRILYVNPAFEQMTGYLAEEVLGKTRRILEGPNTSQAALDRIRRSLKAWEPVREEMINYRKDGSQFNIELSIVPIADDGGWYTHWFAIQRDTTEQVRLRHDLDSSRNRLHQLIEALPQLAWTADPDGRRDWVSDGFAAFVGAEVKDCLGDGWVRYVHPADRELALSRLQADRKAGRMSQAELRLRRTDGEYVWFLKQAIPTLGPDGAVLQWTGTFTDISDRKKAESALRASEQRALLGMQVAGLALAEIDYASGMNHLSPQAAVLFGLGEEALTVPRERVHGAFHPDDLAELQQRIESCLNPAGPGWFYMDHRVMWPDGQVRWLRVRKQVFFEGEAGQRRPVRAMLAAMDITESKLVEAEVRESERRFRDLAESLPQFVWVTDARGKKTYCNQRYLDFVGIPNCELLNMQWDACIHPDDREAASEAWKLAVQNETPYFQEYRLRRHDGEFRHFMARGIPVRNDFGQIDRWLGSSIDVHERKLTEEALRRAEKLNVAGRLASSMSHEINNPLAGVVNLLYLLANRANLDAETRSLVASAQRQLERVTEVTKQSLLFHRESTSPSAVQMASVLDSLVLLHRPATDLKSVVVMRDYRSTPPLVCMAGEIRQALAHIFSNAVEALAERGVLRIRLRPSQNWREPSQQGIRITIADSGRGIGPRELRFIFDAFFTTKGTHATGLGLWIAKDIVTRHRGTIRVRSSTKPGLSGTIFHIYLAAGGPAEQPVSRSGA